VPLFPGEPNFYIQLKQIRIGEEIIPINNYRGFIDSGTTISYFPTEIYNSIINKFNSICNNIPNKKCGKFKNIPGLGYCGFFNTKEDKEKALKEYWPNITLYLEGYNYILRGIDYSYDYNESEEGACLGFEGERKSQITLGGTFMHSHDIIFDKDNQRIGFAVADCNRGNFKGNTNNRNANSSKKDDNNNDNDNDKDVILKEKSDKKKKFIFYLIISILIIVLVIIIFIFIKKLCIIKKNRRFYPQIDNSLPTQNKRIDIIAVK
jgi:hypothetical protein